MAKIDELKIEADELGVKYSPNIGEAKLSEKVEAHYKSLEDGTPAILEVAPEDEEISQAKTKKKAIAKTMGELAVEAEKEARKTHIIVITDNDQRENNFTSTVPVTCGNDHFELGTQRIPLNVPVEVQQGFINVLKEIQIPLAVRGMDGSMTTAMRNRYSISYEDDMKVDNED